MNTPEDDEVNGFGEAAGRFDGPDLVTYEAIHRLTLIAYGYRCAMTGQKFSSVAATLHPELDVVAIRPLDQGGEFRVTNFLCLTYAAADAFARGQIIVASDYALIADRPTLSPELDTALLDRLSLPAEAFFRPDPAALRFHREWVLRRD